LPRQDEEQDGGDQDDEGDSEVGLGAGGWDALRGPEREHERVAETGVGEEKLDQRQGADHESDRTDPGGHQRVGVVGRMM
jgi:hypothetical protein